MIWPRKMFYAQPDYTLITKSVRRPFIKSARCSFLWNRWTIDFVWTSFMYEYSLAKKLRCLKAPNYWTFRLNFCTDYCKTSLKWGLTKTFVLAVTSLHIIKRQARPSIFFPAKSIGRGEIAYFEPLYLQKYLSDRKNYFW